MLHQHKIPSLICQRIYLVEKLERENLDVEGRKGATLDHRSLYYHGKSSVEAIEMLNIDKITVLHPDSKIIHGI